MIAQEVSTAPPAGLWNGLKIYIMKDTIYIIELVVYWLCSQQEEKRKKLPVWKVTIHKILF